MSKAKAPAKAEELDTSKADATKQGAALDAPALAETPAAETARADDQQSPQSTITEPPKGDATAAVTAYVLCAGHIGGRQYAAGVVVEGMPVEVAEAYSAMLDLHSAAVRHAMDAGATVVAYGEV